MKWIEPGLCYCQQVVSILPLFLCNAGSYKYFVVTHERNFECLKYFAKEEVILCLWFDAMWPAQSGQKRTKQLTEKNIVSGMAVGTLLLFPLWKEDKHTSAQWKTHAVGNERQFPSHCALACFGNGPHFDKLYFSNEISRAE